MEYFGKLLRTSEFHHVGEHLVATDMVDKTEHVVEITRGFGKMDGLYSYTIKVVDDQYSTNKLGIV